MSTGAQETSMGRLQGIAHHPRIIWLWITLLATALVAAGIFTYVWLIVKPGQNELPYEVAKTCLQVIGVTVIGCFLTAATSFVQQGRQDAAKALERQREDFKVRTSLLDRSTRCAQDMFVTCQHVRRVKKDTVADPEGPAATKARELLDRTYLEFSTEAQAIETELGARFGELRVKRKGPGQAFLRWHQLKDLLTVYYFALGGRFRGKVLERNSDGYKCEMHAGIDFNPLVADPDVPSPVEVERVIDELREAFWKSMPKFAEAVLRDEIRDL